MTLYRVCLDYLVHADVVVEAQSVDDADAIVGCARPSLEELLRTGRATVARCHRSYILPLDEPEEARRWGEPIDRGEEES